MRRKIGIDCFFYCAYKHGLDGLHLCLSVPALAHNARIVVAKSPCERNFPMFSSPPVSWFGAGVCYALNRENGSVWYLNGFLADRGAQKTATIFNVQRTAVEWSVVNEWDVRVTTCGCVHLIAVKCNEKPFSVIICRFDYVWFRFINNCYCVLDRLLIFFSSALVAHRCALFWVVSNGADVGWLI